MPQLCLISILALLAVGVGALLLLRKRHNKTLKEGFRRLAVEYHGELFPGDLLRGPSVRFSYHGAHILVDTHSTGDQFPRHYTQLRASWPDARLRCHISLQNRLSSWSKKMLGLQDIEIGSPDFDRDYLISGNDVFAVRDLLTDRVRACIGHLRWLMGNDDIYVSITGGAMVIKKRGPKGDYLKLTHFTSMALDLFDEAIGALTPGVDFGQLELSAPDLEGAICQVCGELLQSQIVQCRSCGTPHHEECWEYFGMCSTYGCGQRHHAGR